MGSTCRACACRLTEAISRSTTALAFGGSISGLPPAATAAPVSPPAGSRRSSELPDHSYRGSFPGRRRSTQARMYAVWVKHWRGLISEHLGSDWDVVAHEILWEMQLTVYAR